MFTLRELQLLAGIVGSECDEAHDGFGDALRPTEDYGTPEELDTIFEKIKELKDSTTSD